MSTIPTIPAAKPYDGVAQYRSVGVAIQRFVKAGLLDPMDDRWGRNARVSVDGRGHISNVGRDLYPAVAQLRISFRYYEAHRGGQTQAEQEVAVEQFISALRDVGWTVDESGGNRVDYRWYNVYGPGFTEWVEQAQRNRAEHARRSQEAHEQAVSDSAALKALLEQYGITKYLSPNEARVTLTLAELRTLLGNVTGSGVYETEVTS